MILNLGHTLGHAIEAATEYKPTVRLVRTDTQRNSSWPGARGSIKGRIHCRRLVFSPTLNLAVTRRTIHYRTLGSHPSSTTPDKRGWRRLCRSAIACCVGVEEGRLQCSVLLRLEVGRGVGS